MQEKMHNKFRTPSISLVAMAAVVAGLTVCADAAHAATPSTFAYGGSDYGSTARLGILANTGHTASLPMCTGTAGYQRTNSTAAISLGAAGHIGAVSSHVHAYANGATHGSTGSTHTAATSLLGGLVSAAAVTTSATESQTGTRYSPHGGTTIVGLRIAGRGISAHPAPNTQLTLPGIGRVVLNRQWTSTAYGVRAKTVVGLQVIVDAGNTLGLPTGLIVVGKSTASLRHAVRQVNAAAFGTQLSVARTVSSGPTAAAYAPCGGTGGATVHNDIAGLDAPGLLTSGGVVSTVHTDDATSRTVATARSQIAAVDLLGVIRARTLTVQATATRSGSTTAKSVAGSSLVGLSVNGHTVTPLHFGGSTYIAGIGRLSYGQTVRSSTGIEVSGLRLVLGAARGGMPAGSSVTVGFARAGVR